MDERRTRIRDLTEQLQGLTEQLAASDEKALRLRADYENLQRRTQSQRLDVEHRARAQVLLRVADFVETLEMAHQSLVKAKSPHAGDLARLVGEGHALLRAEGLVAMGAAGQPFDHDRHQAIERVQTTDQPEGTVVNVIRNGYTYQDRVVRHAMVRVASAPPTPTRSDDAEKTD